MPSRAQAIAPHPTNHLNDSQSNLLRPKSIVNNSHDQVPLRTLPLRYSGAHLQPPAAPTLLTRHSSWNHGTSTFGNTYANACHTSRSRAPSYSAMEAPKMAPRAMSMASLPSLSASSNARDSFASGRSSTLSSTASFLSSRSSSFSTDSYTYNKSSARNWRNSWDSYQGLTGEAAVEALMAGKSPATVKRGSGNSTGSGAEKKLKNKPGEALAKLPEELLVVIMEALRELHLNESSSSCETCWMRDACSLALVNKKWRNASRLVL